MAYIQNSQDILNIVKAISIFGISLFLIWFIYYLAMMMREIFKIIKETRENFKKIGDTIDSLKQKIENSASYLSLIVEGIKKIVEMAKEHLGKKETKKKTSKK
jgi:predicted PurR-regulated permease PerM